MKVLEWYANDFPIDRPRTPLISLTRSRKEVEAEYKEWRSKLVDGEPKGETAGDTLRMKRLGMVGLYKEVDINLNGLLAAAKHYESRHMVYEELVQQKEIDESESIEAFKVADDAWQALYSGMTLVGRFNLIGNDGESRQVRTVGFFYNTYSLRYSECEGSTDLESAFNLMAVESIEELA